MAKNKSKKKHLPVNLQSVSIMDKINFTTANGKELKFTKNSYGKESLEDGWQKESGLTYDEVTWEVCQNSNNFTGPGLLHAQSGTTALDIDNLKKTILFFENRFGDRTLIRDVIRTGFRINSPSLNRTKVIYMISDEQLKQLNAIKKTHTVQYSEKGGMIFELRGAGGQDVFPPALYLKKDRETDTDIFYKHIGEYSHEGSSRIGMYPDELFQLQMELLSKGKQTKKITSPAVIATPAATPAAVIKQQDTVNLLRDDGTQSIIYVFNLSFSMDDTLTKCGYIQQSDNKWLSPKSISGNAGIVVNQSTNNPWEVSYSNHANDDDLYNEQHDAFDIAATFTFPHLSLDGAKQEFAKQQSTLRMAIDPVTGNTLDKTVDQFNKEVFSQKKSLTTGKKFNKIKLITGMQLELNPPPPIHYIIEDLLPAGRSLLVGDPKKGKSWFVLYLVILIAAGLPIFGRQVRKQKTVYFALEDSHARIHARTQEIYEQFDITQEAKNNWAYELTIDSLGDGLEDSILDLLSNNLDISLIVIDVLGKVRKVKGVNHLYTDDYSVGDGFKRITDKYPNLSVLVVHHSNKGDKIDVVNMVSGTNGLSGSFDHIYGLSGDKLLIGSRDLKNSNDIELLRTSTGQYTMSAPETPTISSSMNITRKKVYEYILDHAGENQSVKRQDIINGTDLAAIQSI